MRKIYITELFSDDESAARGEYGPEFLEAVWPAVLRVIVAESPIFLFQNETTSDKVFEAMVADFRDSGGRLVEEGLYQMPALELCSRKHAEILKYLSFYNGHLNVFFAVDVGSRDFHRLVGLWPKSDNYALGPERQMGFQDWIAFAERMSRIIDDRTLLGFGHDGQPLYILRPEKGVRF